MKLFIGVAWPYASGPRHLGHLAGAYLPADVVARASRLSGDEVLVISGSDQYGTPVAVGAERAGVDPSLFAERQHQANAASLAAAGVAFDLYTKTATPTHHRVVQDVFTSLWRQGLIFEDQQPAAWCARHRRSLPDRYVEGTCPHCGDPGARGDQCDGCGSPLDPAELHEPRCRECHNPVELRPLRQLFLRLDRLQPAVAGWLKDVSGSWRRGWAAQEAAGALAAGLLPRAVTRDLTWGVPVPLRGWDDRRLYVWFDAVVGYLSATVEWAERRGQPDGWRLWWHGPHVVHRYFVGKDNVWFHALWWPAILSGAAEGLHLPDEIVASHYLLEEGRQLSTSRGHGTTIDDALARWGPDPVRHAVCALSPEGADATIGDEAIAELTRSGLLGAIANPAHRVAKLLWQRFGGTFETELWHSAAVAAQREAAHKLLEDAASAFRQAELRRGLAVVHQLGRTVNQRMARDEPWASPVSEAAAALAALVPWIDALALAAWPVVPSVASRIRESFGRAPQPDTWSLPRDTPGVSAAPAPPLR